MAFSKAKSAKPEYVYCVECNETGVIKIGVSNNPRSRLETIQTHYPYYLSISFVIKHRSLTAYKLEKQIHEELKGYKLRGEWFEKYAIFAAKKFIEWDGFIEYVTNDEF
jgi:hypothetical protein